MMKTNKSWTTTKVDVKKKQIGNSWKYYSFQFQKQIVE